MGESLVLLLMSSEELKRKSKIAKDVVNDLDEPYKIEAFKIILSSLISGHTKQGQKKKKGSSVLRTNSNLPKISLEQKKNLTELSKNCGISTDALSEVITIKNNNIQIIKRPKIKENQKHVLFSLCILAGYKILYDLEWVSSFQLKTCLDVSAVGDLQHSSKSMANESNILSKGKNKGREYKITGKGLDKAYDIIKKLSKDESIL